MRIHNILVIILFSIILISNIYSIPVINNCNDIAFDFKRLDEKVKNIGKRNSLEEIASELSSIAQTDWEKARAIYLWICWNISYDTEAFFKNKYNSPNTQNTLIEGKAVCSGYSDLACELGSLLGLEIVSISGYSKGYNYFQNDTFENTNHAWNAFRVNDVWYLMDVTWGSGYVNDKKMFVKDVTTTWFAMDPYLFFLTHYPENIDWSLLTQTNITIPTLEEWCKWTYIPSYTFEYLWRNDFRINEQIEIIKEISKNAEKVNYKVKYLINILQLKKYGFTNKDIIQFLTYENNPKMYSVNSQFIIIQAPKNRILKKNENYIFEIRADNASSVALISERGVYYYFKKTKSGTFMLEYRAKAGKISICTKAKGDNKFFTAIEYYVE